MPCLSLPPQFVIYIIILFLIEYQEFHLGHSIHEGSGLIYV